MLSLANSCIWNEKIDYILYENEFQKKKKPDVNSFCWFVLPFERGSSQITSFRVI
jgi:hypothetical protein